MNSINTNTNTNTNTTIHSSNINVPHSNSNDQLLHHTSNRNHSTTFMSSLPIKQSINDIKKVVSNGSSQTLYTIKFDNIINKNNIINHNNTISSYTY